MQNSSNKKVVGYLKQLGLSAEQVQVYMYLISAGPSSVLEVSRGLSTGRTKLYPLLEDLQAKQLVVIHERHYGTTYEAADLAALGFLVSEYELKATALRAALPAATSELQKIKVLSPAGSRIVEYRGIDGIKQMNYNLSNAVGEHYIFELANLDKHQGIPRYFAEKQRQIQIDKKVKSYDLTNNPHWKVDTNVKDFEKYAHGRYIDPKIFEIKFETYIYDTCVGLLNYEASDVFGVEIYNADLAAQQKQLFQLLWGMAKKL